MILTLTPQELALREALEASDVLRGRLNVSVAAAALNCVPSALFTRTTSTRWMRRRRLQDARAWRSGATARDASRRACAATRPAPA